MEPVNYTTTILVDNTANEVFYAINNVKGWWSEEIQGNTDKLNDEWYYHYEDVHRCKMKIIELIPNKKVVWEVIENFFSFTKDRNEWNGNQLVFEITPVDGKTQLQFTQIGLVTDYECFDICENAWNTYIQKSLYSLITLGVGQPNAKEKPQTENEKNLSSNFTTTFFVNQTPKQVFNAIRNVSAWWQGEVIGNTSKLNDEFTYQMKEHHYSKQKLIELIPNEKVVWMVTESKLNSYNNQTEWTNTKIIFDINEINNKTQVRFTHFGLIPKFECYGSCSWAWEKLIKESLFSLITTGKGTNVFE
ncbi:SRPBCC domain-containing protein [Flavobacterium sp.]|uniref:SRPBCC domain-containing protein n=1 Tax=Flavobacterium sp. TaxID=239 RepID=UPI003264543B